MKSISLLLLTAVLMVMLAGCRAMANPTSGIQAMVEARIKEALCTLLTPTQKVVIKEVPLEVVLDRNLHALVG